MVKKAVETLFGNGGTVYRMIVTAAITILLALGGWSLNQTNKMMTRIEVTLVKVEALERDVSELKTDYRDLSDVSSRVNRNTNDIRELRESFERYRGAGR